jgi:Ca-activated chloride channel family protein
MKTVTFLIMTCFFVNNVFSSYSYFVDKKAKNAWDKKDYEQVLKILNKAQVNHPSDPRLNYNIANAYYKLGKFKDAQLNYERSVQNCIDSDISLKERSYSNWGNACYKNALRVLPDDWEKQESTIDNKTIDFAIQETKNSIAKFKNSLVLNKENKRAKNNLKKAEELLKKLENKKKEQQKNQDQENKDQQQQKKEQKQEKQDKQSKDKKSSDGKDEQQGRDKQQDQNKEGSEKREQEKGQGKDDKFDDKKTKQDTQDQKKDSHDQPSDQSDKTREQVQPESQDIDGKEKKQDFTQPQSAQGTEQEVGERNHQKRRMGAILDNLQADESKMQKILIKQKSKGKETPLSGKNW